MLPVVLQHSFQAGILGISVADRQVPVRQSSHTMYHWGPGAAAEQELEALDNHGQGCCLHPPAHLCDVFPPLSGND